MHDDPTHLTVRLYTPDDASMVAEWWDAREKPFPEALLPPLGVVVCDDSGPAVALWCYECYGVGVCFLEFPVSRPGQSLSGVYRAFAYAVEACKMLAGKSVDPPGEYHLFRAFTLPPIARSLKRMGFAAEKTQRIAVNLYTQN